jgi:hypothetical protein
MYNTNIPAERELPSTKKLVKSTVIAAIVAGVLLVTVVMPAEYGIDPTGVGKITGLKQMGDIKMSLAQEAAAEKQATAQATQEAPVATAVVKTVSDAPVAAEPQPSSAIASPVRQDETMLTLAPNEGAEIKVVMKKGEKVTYSWSTNGGVANFDVHGDSKELNIYYHGYYKGREKSKEGVLEAAFDGSHGWFWRNRTANPLTVTLKTNGTYTDIKKFQ